jgi:hypothetical protein
MDRWRRCRCLDRHFAAGCICDQPPSARLILLVFYTCNAACLLAVGLLLPLRTWPYTGPLLLFQGLLTLINAPFNWASIGLTRALLRRGLELGGWWPYFLGVVNAVLATSIVAVLTLTMVIAVQAFDELVVHGGGSAILPLEPLFDGISKNPGKSEYWWIYALLLATMIPSVIGLMIGGASLISGMPGLPNLLLRFMPEGKAVPAARHHTDAADFFWRHPRRRRRGISRRRTGRLCDAQCRSEPT